MSDWNKTIQKMNTEERRRRSADQPKCQGCGQALPLGVTGYHRGCRPPADKEERLAYILKQMRDVKDYERVAIDAEYINLVFMAALSALIDTDPAQPDDWRD